MSQGSGGKLRLLVVDDEPDNLDLLYRTFRRDYQVFKAISGRNALEVLELEGEMAIIISDQRMPGMNGTEFLSKTVDPFPDTIRMVLTGYTDVEDLVGAINSGKVFKYITKPWMPDELKAVVQQAAETYQVLKNRTNELNRALRRESLFNAVTTAIRESLDYRSMLQTIVATIGKAFEADDCMLQAVEGDRLTTDTFFHQSDHRAANDREGTNPQTLQEDLAQDVLHKKQTQLLESGEQENHRIQLIVPLTYQQEFLAILSLNRYGTQSPWQPEDIQLIEGVSEQAALAISQAKLYQRIQEQTQQMRAELEVARQIQGNLLRRSWPEVEGVKIQACCYPAREVGGDFFEVFVHPQGEIWVAVGDVSGKGVPAALFMASALSVLRGELAQESPPDPHVVMHNLNGSLSEDLISNNRFITMAIARYNPITRELAYANAGHIYPFVYSPQLVAVGGEGQGSDQEPNYLKVRGIPLGIRYTWKAASGTVVMNPGEIFLLMSDGLTEATFIEAGEGNGPPTSSMLQEKGLWRLLTQEPYPLSLDSLLARIRAHTEVQEDDQTILSLEAL
ncbi:MAG: SpoIIE family protein phosphatase [Leptolyngbyaceae bacterium]|nr:SpoIIE family protein phosphatase [Leptolyngbyaceae bacterium]